MGYSVSQNCGRMEEILRQLASINVDNIKGLILYTVFQKKVMEDDFGALDNFLAIRRYEDSSNALKKRWEHEESNYVLNSDATVIIVSGNKESMGTVIDTNYEIKELLGYRKEEFVGENINLIIPEIVGANHCFYMEKYFKERKDSNVNNVISKLVLPQHSKGYLVACTAFIRLVPNLERGVQFLSFLLPAKDVSELRSGSPELRPEEAFVFLLDENCEIVGFCKNFMLFCCEKEFNSASLKRYLESKEKINMRNICGDLFEEESVRAMEHSEGLTRNIDLKPLKTAISAEIVDSYDVPDLE